MPRTHPPDENGRLLRRFYEPLTLLNVLDPARGAQSPDITSEDGLEEQGKLWRNFLDQLSYVCDFKTGGDTVTAIAAPRNPEHPVFCLASNSKYRYKSGNHLRQVLKLLGQIYTSENVISIIQDDITVQCIEFSRDRVKAYSGWLMDAIQSARLTISEGVSSEDTFILNEFQRLEELRSTARNLCLHAYSLRRHGLMEILNKRHIAHSKRGVWSDIRRYLGRLGSWSKAVRILVMGATNFPHLIENAEVQVVETKGPADIPDSLYLTGLTDAVRRIVPRDEEHLYRQLCQTLEEVNAVVQVEDSFREAYVNIKPRPHAELILLEYFHRNHLEFVTDDRYIGCSKPSCYCCQIYTQCHPGRFAPRPCHGNIWINWAPPDPLPLVERSSTRSRIRPQENHTFKMLQAMLVSIRRELVAQIMSRRPKRARLPDSTTGMSSVILGNDKVLHSVAASSSEQYVDRALNVLIDSVLTPSATLGLEHKADTKRFKDYRATTNDEPETNTFQNWIAMSQDMGDEAGGDSRPCQEATEWMRVVPESDDSDDAGILLFKGRKQLT